MLLIHETFLCVCQPRQLSYNPPQDINYEKNKEGMWKRSLQPSCRIIDTLDHGRERCMDWLQTWRHLFSSMMNFMSPQCPQFTFMCAQKYLILWAFITFYLTTSRHRSGCSDSLLLCHFDLSPTYHLMFSVSYHWGEQ